MKPVRPIGSLVVVSTFFLLSELNLFAVSQRIHYTKRGVDAIKTFRPAVFSFLTQGYPKKNGYLLKWIRGNFFHLKEIDEAVEENYKWRQENNIYSAHTESLTAHNKCLPCKNDGYGKKARPNLAMHFSLGKWKVRNYVVADKQYDARRLTRLIHSCMALLALSVLRYNLCT